MIALKALRAGAVAPFSGIRWPMPTGGEPGAYDAERAWQAAWLADRLGLDTP